MVIKLKTIIILFLKGVAIGGSMMVPGVSGGSIAIIFGIYDKLINAVANFFKQKLKSIIFLLTVALGGVLGVIILSKGVYALLKFSPYETSFFFFGAVLGGLPLLFKKSDFKICFKDFLFIILGALTVVAINFIPQFNNNANIVFYIISGFIGSIALILPGISISYCLMVFGVYESILNAINNFDFMILIPFLLSMLIGVFCFSKIISMLLQKYQKKSFLLIIGFLLGSLTELFVGLPPISNLITSVLSLVMGAYFIYLISKVSN